MSIHKLLRGVLEVVTPSGVYYLIPSLTDRLYLAWIFRNFRTLPLGVLTDPQRRKLESIATRRGKPQPHDCDEILGTIDCMPVMKKPVQSATRQRVRQSAEV